MLTAQAAPGAGGSRAACPAHRRRADTTPSPARSGRRSGGSRGCGTPHTAPAAAVCRRASGGLGPASVRPAGRSGAGRPIRGRWRLPGSAPASRGRSARAMRRTPGSRSRCGRRRPRRSDGRTGRRNPPPVPDAASAACRPAPAGRARGRRRRPADHRRAAAPGSSPFAARPAERVVHPRRRRPRRALGGPPRSGNHLPRTGSRRPATRRRCSDHHRRCRPGPAVAVAPGCARPADRPAWCRRSRGPTAPRRG